MTVNEKQLVGYVDVTPMWQEILDVLVDAVENGTTEQHDVALNELRKMARAADAFNAAQRGGPRS